MKFLKKLLIFILALGATLLIAALFVDGNYEVRRDIVIAQNSDDVFDYIRYLKNQSDYGVWQQRDPEMTSDYSGTDGEVGFIYFWKSNIKGVGSGQQEITHVEVGKRIDTHLHLDEYDSDEQAYMLTDPIDDKTTKVTWGFTGKLPYPWNLFRLFINFDDEIGPDLEEGLQNLKAHLEQDGL